MSTSWDIYCVDCDAEMGVDGLPEWRLEESLQGIIDHRKAIVALSGLIPLCVEVELFIDYKRVDLAWLGQHVDHALRPRNEYGGFRSPAG